VSVTFEYPAAGKDANQLHDALVAAGLVPERVETYVAVEVTPDPDPQRLPTETRTPTLRLTYPDGTARAPVDALVAAHVPQARYDPAERLARVRAIRVRERERAGRDRDRTAPEAVREATTLAELRQAVADALEVRR
jgi:hypothetical protein